MNIENSTDQSKTEYKILMKVFVIISASSTLVQVSTVVPRLVLTVGRLVLDSQHLTPRLGTSVTLDSH